MKFLVPNYSCLQNPWLGATAPRSPFSLSSTEFVEPPRTKFLGTPLVTITDCTHSHFEHNTTQFTAVSRHVQQRHNSWRKAQRLKRQCCQLLWIKYRERDERITGQHVTASVFQTRGIAVFCFLLNDVCLLLLLSGVTNPNVLHISQKKGTQARFVTERAHKQLTMFIWYVRSGWSL